MTLPEHPERARPERPTGRQDTGQQEPGESADGSRDISAPVASQPTATQPTVAQPTVAQLAGDYAAKAGLHRSSNGNIDVLKSAGGIQGIAESILPGLVFLIAFTIDRENLTLAVTASLAVAAVFTVARLVQRKPLTQALAGFIGVGLSAWLATSTGKAENFYVLGFFTNLGYILAMSISVAVRWPIAGLLFGFIRNEGLEWRKDPKRVRAYSNRHLGDRCRAGPAARGAGAAVLHGGAGPRRPRHHPAPHGRPALHPRRLDCLAADPAGPGARRGRREAELTRCAISIWPFPALGNGHI